MILKALSKLGIQKIFLNLLQNVCKSPIILSFQSEKKAQNL